MTRLYAIAEGQSEAAFITQILKPHLEDRRAGLVEVFAPRLSGHHTFARLSWEVRNCLGKPDADTVVTTMIDLYRIARDFPGLTEPLNDAPAQKRVLHLEGRFNEEIGDRRFRPYIQVHEFEALLLTNLTVLADQYPTFRKELKELAERLNKQFGTPEEVDRDMPPSRRILQVVPEYDKILDGVAALTKIGLPALRARCPHFAEWCNFLETVS